MNELELYNADILAMVANTVRQGQESIKMMPLDVFKSDSYGAHMHRTWAFKTDCGGIIGTIERYWGGLKMICSVHGGSPRTSFFTEDGIRTTNKGLKGQ